MTRTLPSKGNVDISYGDGNGSCRNEKKKRCAAVNPLKPYYSRLYMSESSAPLVKDVAMREKLTLVFLGKKP